MSFIARLLELLASIFGTNTDSDETQNTHREAAKEAIKRRMSEPDGVFGTVVDYSLRNEGDVFSATDWRIVFDVDLGEFGDTQLVFNIPDRFEGESELSRFIAAVGGETVEDLDAALGSEIDVRFNPDGTINVQWSAVGDDVTTSEGGPKHLTNDKVGTKYVNENVTDDPDVVDPQDLATDGGSE